MKPIDDIKAFYRNAAINTNPAGDKVVLTDALQAGGLKTEKRTAPKGPRIRRLIMKTRIGRLAAAAVLALVAALGITLMYRSSKPVYGMTEALERIEQAKTLHVKGWRHQRHGDDEITLPYEHWYDLQSGRYRSETAYYRDGEIGNRLYVCDGQYVMSEGAYRPAGGTWHKTVDFERVDPTRRNDIGWVDWHRQLRQIEGFSRVGQEVIDGERFDIWQGEYDSGVGGRVDRVRLQTWLSPATASVGRVKRWEQQEGGWVQTSELTTLEHDIPLSDALFGTEPRPGHEIRTPKEQATVRVRQERDIYKGTEFDYAPLNYRVRHVFALEDGSLLVCWQGVDAKESRDQSRYFKQLVAGGDLPRLPVELYALSPEPNVRDVLFVGFHLAHTEKETEQGRRWYEWSLFVPDKEPPEPNIVLVYRPHYRLNVDRTDEIDISVKQIGTPDPQKIESEEDFNTLVWGAMAERSDGRSVPEQVTYENVLWLADEIRTSLAQ